MSLLEKDDANGWLYGGDASSATSQFDFNVSAVYTQVEKKLFNKFVLLATVRKEINSIKYEGKANYYGEPLDFVSFNMKHNLWGGKFALQYFTNDILNLYASMSPRIKTVDYKSDNAGWQFVESLHHTGFAIMHNHHLDYYIVTSVYKEWGGFFNSDVKHSYTFYQDTQDGYFPYR